MALAETHDALGLVHYLLVFDGPNQLLIRCMPYTNADEAIAAYATAEVEFRAQVGVEVVLVGSDSLDTVKRTHGQYFSASGSPDLPPIVDL